MPTFPSTATSKVSTPSPDLIEQFVFIIGDRIIDSCDRTNDLLRNLVDQVRGLGEGEVLDHSYSIETLNPSSSAASAFISQPLNSMPPNYFAGQSPPPRSALPNMAEPVRSVQLTGLTGVAVASLATPSPFASIPCSAGPSRTNELANFDFSYTTVACNVPPIFPRGSGVHRRPISDDVHNDSLRRALISSVQTIFHHTSSSF